MRCCYRCKKMKPLSEFPKDISKNICKACKNKQVANARRSDPCIYMFYDDNGEIVYVGKTIQFRRRMQRHFVSEEGRFKDKGITRIDMAKTKSEADMHLYEMYYINKYKPEYNEKDLGYDELTVELPSLIFEDMEVTDVIRRH